MKTTKNSKDASAQFATNAIHYAYDARDCQGSLNPPMHLSSTYTFENADHGAALFAGEQQGHFYSRISNPTVEVLEKRIAKLENAEAGLAVASGIAAITSSLWTLLKAGDEIIVDKTLYGCTYAFLHHGLSKFAVTVKHVDLCDPNEFAKAISDKTRVVYYETPANPNMRIVDIAAISQIAKQHSITSVVDNTYATPVITRPIELGADLVIHSATKYLGGHGDLIAGLVVGSKELIDRVRLEGVKDMTGACMSPFTAMLILRGIKTLQLRMQQHSANAQSVAEYLSKHSAVKSVYYPGLVSFEQHDLAARQMSMYSGVIAFELVDGMLAGKQLMDSLSLIQCAVSLGDAESLIQHPASMTHSTYTEQERAEHGISDGLIRISVGLEAQEDIIADLDQALQVVAKQSLAIA